jgi:predicted TIM-barrel fold metal-dependent hydrolase
VYQGPIIDAHHHLWDLSLKRHMWLLEDDPALAALGDISFMRHTYLPADYFADVGAANVVGTVHIEAVWDRRRSPVEETAWLEMLERPRGIASRCIAYAGIAAPGAEAVLEAQAAFPRVAGVRETIRWHPDPAKRWAEAGIVGSDAFRRGVGLLRRHGFVLELLMNPYQAEEVAQLARDFPDQRILVNHCGTPVDRDAAGLERWREGLRAMAACPNIALKVSNFGAYGPDKTLPALRSTVMTCIEAFGTRRSLFGTDYPVARRNMTYAAMVSSFAEIIAGFSADEQGALFYGNAREWYGF